MKHLHIKSSIQRSDAVSTLIFQRPGDFFPRFGVADSSPPLDMAQRREDEYPRTKSTTSGSQHNQPLCLMSRELQALFDKMWESR